MDIALSHIAKRYSHKVVLEDLSLSFKGGQIHALLGENGAGKSTTASILSGALPADSGSILADGREISISNSRDAAAAGIYCVRQRPLLALGISSADNIMLGTEYAPPLRGCSRSSLLRAAERFRDEWAPDLDLRARTGHLGGDGRFYTALISALICSPKVLILDEPSALLDWEQRRSLYANIRKLASSGMNVIVITHIMQEAQLYTDTVTVLKKGGKVREYGQSSEFTISPASPGIASGHSGPAAEKTCTAGNCASCTAGCSVSYEKITVRPPERPALYDVSFTARCGEITLIGGLQESGLGTLENVMTGMEECRAKGTFFLTDGTQKRHMPVVRLSPSYLRFRTGMHTAIISSDRTFRASNPHLTVGRMLSAVYPEKSSAQYENGLIAAAHVSISRGDEASALSGGMLQRLIIARELDSNPRLIIACEPLQGLDVEACGRITALLSDAARRGCIVIVLSSAEFPSPLCGNIYHIEGGSLSEVKR
jgi:ABC-type uncharacterized transport system ATPase subunit